MDTYTGKSVEEKLKKDIDELENWICAGLAENRGFESSAGDIAFIRRRFADFKRLRGWIK